MTPETAPGRLPAQISSEPQLEELLSRPDQAVVEDLAQLQGDLVILGAGGKIGPSLARMARRALDAAGHSGRVIAVSRFSSAGVRDALEAQGVETIACDLLDREAVDALPLAANVIFMAGRKFGSSGNEPLTWAMNTVAPALVAAHYCQSRIVAYSTGNVYGLGPVQGGGAVESDPLCPAGEYAQSCLGRERVFQYYSRRYGTPAVLVRLNYAVELRYGVLLDVATRVARGKPVDLTMGNANVIWQGDANRAVLRCLSLAESPPLALNLTGPETVSIRAVARCLGELLGTEPVLDGCESETALLSNASRAHALFGYPEVPLDTLLRWVAHWVRIGGPTLAKPTHYDVRDGRFSQRKPSARSRDTAKLASCAGVVYG